MIQQVSLATRHPNSHPADFQGIGMAVLLGLARGAGELKLASGDPRIQPTLDYNYLREPIDRQRLRLGVRTSLELAKYSELSRIAERRLDPADEDLTSDNALDEWVLRRVSRRTMFRGPARWDRLRIQWPSSTNGADCTALIDSS